MRAKYLQIFLNKLPLTFSYSPKGVHSPVRVGKNGYLSSIAISSSSNSSSTSISSSYQYLVGHQRILETINGWWDTWTDRQTDLWTGSTMAVVEAEKDQQCLSMTRKFENNRKISIYFQIQQQQKSSDGKKQTSATTTSPEWNRCAPFIQ